MTALSYAIDQRGHYFTKHEWIDMTVLKPLIDHNPLMVSMVPSIAGLWACSKCNASQYNMVIDHEAKTITAPTECPLTKGILTNYLLEVPSGVMVVANDMRELFGIPRDYGDSMPSYNSDLGQSVFMLGLARDFKLAYGPVGNSSPGLYKTPTGYEIANPAYNEHEEWDGYYGGEDDENPPLAQIITDLWAFCIADLLVYEGHGGTLKPYTTYVEVEPGTYRFTHHTGELNFKHDTNERIVYTTITKIGA